MADRPFYQDFSLRLSGQPNRLDRPSLCALPASRPDQPPLHLARSSAPADASAPQRREALKLRRELSHLLLDMLPHPAIVVGRQRSVLAANRMARELGARIGESCWKSMGSIASPECEAAGGGKRHCPQCGLAEALRGRQPVRCGEVNVGGQTRDTYWVPLDDGTCVKYFIDVTARVEAEKALRLARDELEQRIQQRTSDLMRTIGDLEIEARERIEAESESKLLQKLLLQASVQERQRIGQDLHDSLGQTLTGISFLNKVLQKRLARKALPEAAEAEQIALQIKECIAQTRRLARGLAPVRLESGGLVEALRELARDVSARFSIRCEFRCALEGVVSDAVEASHLYHIAQEAVTNAIRHGKARRICIRLDGLAEQVKLSIRDDGVGLPAQMEGKDGMGLRIMRYRAGVIGGALAVTSAPKGGTVVTCCLKKIASN